MDNLLTSYFSSVSILVNVNGNKMFVIGNDTLGYPVSGLISYPTSSSASFAVCLFSFFYLTLKSLAMHLRLFYHPRPFTVGKVAVFR